MIATEKPTADRLCYGVDEVCAMLGISHAHAYKSMKAGRLRTIKILGRRLVPADVVRDLLAEAK